MQPSPSPFEILTPEEDPTGWDAFVKRHPARSVFHLAGMCRAFDQSSRSNSLAIAAKDRQGEIQALIAPIRMETFVSVAPTLTARAIMFGEPLCENTDQSISAMKCLLRHHEKTASQRVLLTEVRSVTSAVSRCPILADQGYQPKRFCNFVIDLNSTQEALWRQIGKQMRGNIARSERRGVEIETGSSLQLTSRAHAIIQRTLRQKMVPFPEIDLFEHVKANLGDVLQVRVATFKGQDVAGAVSLAWGDRYFAWYGGTERLKGVHPFALIVWDEIKWARDRGYHYYDFGGAGNPDRPYGPREFKSRFHGHRVEYGRCTRVYSPRLMTLAECGYKSLKLLAGVK